MFVQKLIRDNKIYVRVFCGVFISIIVTIVTGCDSNRPYPCGSIIERNGLALRLNEKLPEHPVILDVRSKAEYDKGHIAGAVRVDPSEWKQLSLASETGLDHETLWKNRIGALGISGSDSVLIYDDGSMTKAARIWFIFQHFGVPDTEVLNGGYPILKPLIKSGRIAVSKQQTKPTPVKFEHISVNPARVALIERQQVRKAIENKEAQIFDTRTHDEYTGKQMRNNPRWGHLPTAINLPHNKLLDNKGRLKPPKTIAAMFEKAGFKRGSPIIVHCDGGGRASLAALAAECAGYGPVMNYYLSFGDWAADASCPIEKQSDNK